MSRCRSRRRIADTCLTSELPWTDRKPETGNTPIQSELLRWPADRYAAFGTVYFRSSRAIELRDRPRSKTQCSVRWPTMLRRPRRRHGFELPQPAARSVAIAKRLKIAWRSFCRIQTCCCLLMDDAVLAYSRADNRSKVRSGRHPLTFFCWVLTILIAEQLRFR